MLLDLLEVIVIASFLAYFVFIKINFHFNWKNENGRSKEDTKN